MPFLAGKHKGMARRFAQLGPYQVRPNGFWHLSHVWLGRLAIVLGIVNGAVGLYFARPKVSKHSCWIAYLTIAPISLLVWLIVSIRAFWINRQTVRNEYQMTRLPRAGRRNKFRSRASSAPTLVDEQELRRLPSDAETLVPPPGPALPEPTLPEPAFSEPSRVTRVPTPRFG